MYNRLILYINRYGLLYEYQFGFQKGKSTHMAPITLIDKISEALDQGDLVIGIFPDFSKTFVTGSWNSSSKTGIIWCPGYWSEMAW